jgi:hypothetical protein
VGWSGGDLFMTDPIRLTKGNRLLRPITVAPWLTKIPNTQQPGS